MQQDGLFLEDSETGEIKKLNLRDEQSDQEFRGQVVNDAKRAGQESALLTQQEINQATQQAYQYGEQLSIQQAATKFLENNPDMAQNIDLLGHEVSQIRPDPVGDPYHEKRLEQAATRVRAGLRRLDKQWHKEQELKHGSGLAINPLGQMIESMPDADVEVEEPGKSRSFYVDLQRQRRHNLKKTHSREGEI